MSITAAQRFRLGVFIIVAAIAALALLIVGIGVKFSKQTVNYYSEFSGESLSGLTKGMDVKFRGIPIGKVSAISYNPNDLDKIRVEFEVEKEFPMKEDMIVETGLSGITGLKYIEITGGTNSSALLPPNSLIPSRPSLMGTITEKAEKIIESIDKLLVNLNSITNRDTLSDLFESFKNINEITSNVKDLSVFLGYRVDSMTTTLNNLSKNVEKTMNEISQSGHLMSIMSNVDSAVISLNWLISSFGLTFAQSREDLSATFQDLQQTMENFNEFSAMLTDNPSILLYGTPQKKRKTK